MYECTCLKLITSMYESEYMFIADQFNVWMYMFKISHFNACMCMFKTYHFDEWMCMFKVDQFNVHTQSYGTRLGHFN